MQLIGKSYITCDYKKLDEFIKFHEQLSKFTNFIAKNTHKKYKLLINNHINSQSIGLLLS